MSSPAATARSQFTFSDRRLGGSVRYTREPRLDPEAAAPLTLTSDPGPELDTAATEVTEVGSLASSVSRQYGAARWARAGQGGSDGRGQPTASPMLTAIMSGGVGISGRELYKYR